MLKERRRLVETETDTERLTQKQRGRLAETDTKTERETGRDRD